MTNRIWSDSIVQRARQALFALNRYRTELVHLDLTIGRWSDEDSLAQLARTNVTRFSPPCDDFDASDFDTYGINSQVIANLAGLIENDGRTTFAATINRLRRNTLKDANELKTRISLWQKDAAIGRKGKFPNGIPSTYAIGSYIITARHPARLLADEIAIVAGLPRDTGAIAWPSCEALEFVERHETDPTRLLIARMSPEMAVKEARAIWSRLRKTAETTAMQQIEMAVILPESEFDRLLRSCRTAIEAMIFLQNDFGPFNKGDRYDGRREVDVLNDFNRFFYDGEGPWAEEIRTRFRSLAKDAAFAEKGEPEYLESMISHMTEKYDRSIQSTLQKVNGVVEALNEPSVQDRYPNGIAEGCTSVCEFVLKEMARVRRQFEAAVSEWYRKRTQPRPHGIKQPEIGVVGLGNGAETPVFGHVNRIVTDVGREIALSRAAVAGEQPIGSTKAVELLVTIADLAKISGLSDKTIRTRQSKRKKEGAFFPKFTQTDANGLLQFRYSEVREWWGEASFRVDLPSETEARQRLNSS